MKNISIIQAVLIGVSVVAIFIAVVSFAIYRGGGSNKRAEAVVLWGTFPSSSFNSAKDSLGNPKLFDGLIYVEKNPETFEEDFLMAIAEGNGPDLVIIDERQVISNHKRLSVIPFNSFPLRDYQDYFLDEASLLVTKQGILGYPFLLDPLVMFYNKNTLTDEGYSKPPQTWTEVLSLAPIFTKKDTSFNISKSTIALGSFENINNAKEIFWTLVLQAGSPVIDKELNTETGTDRFISVLNNTFNYTLMPSYAATNFYTQFSNPSKTVYSWNRSLQNSQNMFISGDLAFYLGFASELSKIKKINPNLNFDIATIPQSQSSTRKSTYGRMYVLSIPKSSKNPFGAREMMNTLVSSDVQKAFYKEFEVAPVRRDLLSASTEDSLYDSVIKRSAIFAQGVLEPDSKSTSNIIKELIDTVVSGQEEITNALTKMNDKMIILLNKYNE